MRITYGIDASFSRINRQTFQRFYDDGYRVFVQCLWTGGYASNDGIQAVAALNLYDAKEVGFVIAGYSNANPWWSVGQSVIATKANAGMMWPHIDVVAVDVELEGTTEQQILDLCEALEGEGKRVCIYSARWFYRQSGSPDWSRLAKYPLWNAWYDDDPDIDFEHSPYGPWTMAQVVGEQYGGATINHSISVDLNVFDEEFWMGVTEERIRQIAREEDEDENSRINVLLAAMEYRNRAAGLALAGDWKGLQELINEVSVGK